LVLEYSEEVEELLNGQNDDPYVGVNQMGISYDIISNQISDGEIREARDDEKHIHFVLVLFNVAFVLGIAHLDELLQGKNHGQRMADGASCFREVFAFEISVEE
jgi:hypothetical protein